MYPPDWEVSEWGAELARPTAFPDSYAVVISAPNSIEQCGSYSGIIIIEDAQNSKMESGDLIEPDVDSFQNVLIYTDNSQKHSAVEWMNTRNRRYNKDCADTIVTKAIVRSVDSASGVFFELDDTTNKDYLTTFNKILSTFKFLD